MFNDRDLAVIGSGAVLSVCCLLLPVSFAWKITVGLIVLVLSMVFALMRLGPDRLPVEAWVSRRVRFYFRPRFWVFHERGLPAQPASTMPTQRKVPEAEAKSPSERAKPGISFDWVSVSAPRLAGILLVLAGLYFLYGLWNGDIADISMILGEWLP